MSALATSGGAVLHNHPRCKDSHGKEASVHDLEGMTEQCLVQAADVEDVLQDLVLGEYPEVDALLEASVQRLRTAVTTSGWTFSKLAYPHLAAASAEGGASC